jgi:hypothetical protein
MFYFVGRAVWGISLRSLTMSTSTNPEYELNLDNVRDGNI